MTTALENIVAVIRRLRVVDPDPVKGVVLKLIVYSQSYLDPESRALTDTRTNALGLIK